MLTINFGLGQPTHIALQILDRHNRHRSRAWRSTQGMNILYLLHPDRIVRSLEGLMKPVLDDQTRSVSKLKRRYHQAH